MSTKKKSSSHTAGAPLSHRGIAPHALTVPTPAPAAVSAVPGEAAMLNPYGPGVGQCTAASLFWHNLLLLGFDPVAEAARSGSGPLSPTVFERPNARAMQLLLHWLLSLIRACPAADAHVDAPEWKDLLTVFQHSYPCIDRTQARDFLAACTAVLLSLEKGSAAVFPPGTIRKSHFAAPQGERMNVIFWHLSTYALQLTLARTYASFPVPSVSLPALNEPALFPHCIKALKAHIVAQSQTYITKLGRMTQAEDGWRAAAADITAQYQEAQQAVAALAPQHTAPRIPGQPTPEDIDKQLFTITAHNERMRKLVYVRELHAELNELHARTEQQRATLNLVLNGAWQPVTLSRLQLEKLLSPRTQQQQQQAKTAADASSPLNLHAVVSEWNDSLAQMQSMLRQFLQSPSSSPAYLAGLAEADTNAQQQLKEHTLKLTNLRTLSHHLRAELLPELESDLVSLQRQLRAAGTYSGPIHTPSTPAPAPSLMPPTPFHSNAPHTSLAVPHTPAMQQAGYARVHFTPSNIVPHRLPSRIHDSVRRAAHSSQQQQSRSSARPAQLAPSWQQQQQALHTIVDEDTSHSHALLSPITNLSSIPSSSQLHHTRDAFLASAEALASPPNTTASFSGGSGNGPDDASPQFPKKLVFSPSDGAQGRSSGGGLLSPPSLAEASSSSVSTNPYPYSAGRSSLSPYTAAPGRIEGRFISPLPPNTSGSVAAASSTPSYATSASRGYRASPNAHTDSLGEGLLGEEELFTSDDYSASGPVPPQPRPAAAATAVRGQDGFVEDEADELPDDEEEDEEVVFARADEEEEKETKEHDEHTGSRSSPQQQPQQQAANNTRRRVSASSLVDPNAPTPQAPVRSESRFTSSQQQQQQQRQQERTPPTYQPHKYTQQQQGFLSPAYTVEGQGLLDDF